MAGRNRTQTLDDIWGDLEDGLTSIYARKPMEPNRYMKLYTYVYDFCTSVTANQNSPVSIAPPTNRGRGRNIPANQANRAAGTPQQGADFVGQDLYNKLKAFIHKHIEEIRDKASSLNGEALLKYFSATWDQFRFCSKVVDGIFAYLNRHWIRRELEEGHVNTYVIYTLALVTWKEVMKEVMMNAVAAGVLTLIENERQGITINSLLVKGVVECFVELGIDEHPEPTIDKSAGGSAHAANNARLKVYKTYFEKRFLEETESFYINEAETFLQGNSVVEYLKKVEARLTQEQNRCETILHISTLTPLGKCCEKVLITRHLEAFQTEFSVLLDNHRQEDLGRIYMLCNKVDGLSELRSLLEGHVKKMGLDAVDKIQDQANSDPKLYVNTLLEVHNKYANLVSTAFDNESGFVQALDKASTAFINKNAVTQTEKESGTILHTNKCPELLARYCDQVLRKSARNSDDIDMDDLLTQVMIIFKYIEDKDVFQKFYTKAFAKRLVHELSASDESESSMIAKLKQMCGFEYTSKMQRMFTDSSLSKEMSDTFRDHCNNHGQKLPCDFTIQVLGANSWPSQPPMPLTLPAPLRACVDGFAGYYNQRHSGRKLSWVYGQSRGDIVSWAFSSKRFTFTALTTQMCALMLYNDADSLSFAMILEALGMKKEQCLPIMLSLVKAELLKLPPGIEAADAGEPGTTYTLNTSYNSRKIKVDLTKTVMRHEQVQEKNEVQQNVDDNRKMVIQAAIVRIMKMRKRQAHQQLIAEVFTQVQNRFIPKVPMIKKCIDVLIEKEYIQRVEGEKDLYEYLA